jgi:hypothetical protein
LTGEHGAAVFRWFVFLAAFLILPNLLLPLAGRPLNLLVSGAIDLDYPVVALLALFVPRRATFLLLLAAILADFIHAACATYLFSPSEFISSMRFGGMLSTTRTTAIFWTLALVVLMCLLTTLSTQRASPGKQKRLTAGALLASISVLLLIQAIISRGHLLSSEGEALIRVPSASLVQRQWTYHRYERGARLANMRAMPSASALALGHLRDSAPSNSAGPGAVNQLPNFVQILVESWGQPKDEALRKALLAPYADAKVLARYRVLQGTMPFDGPTTAGEARELCQTHVGFNTAHGSVEQMQHCLPMRLRGMGYTALAVHGFNGAMFDRAVWYPQMGFQEIWFEDRLRALGMPECPGPFAGTCDAAIADWLGERLSQPRQPPLFVHWVTLNSHLPVPLPAPVKSPASCAVSAASRDNASICSWYQLVAVVHESVREMALKPLSRPTIFVVVGDHAPPFDMQAERTSFASNDVPYLILLPRAASR